MVRKTKAEAEETRAKLLEAAGHVFVEKGVAKASLEEIAERAGVTRGAIYWHFKNKTDLFKAMSDELHRPFLSYILEDLEKNHPEPLQQLKELSLKLLMDLVDDGHKRRLLTVFFLRSDYAGDMANVLNCHCEMKEEKLALFKQYFERAQQKGFIGKDADPRVLAVSFSCYIGGILTEFLRYPEHFNLRELAQPLVEQYFKSFD